MSRMMVHSTSIDDLKIFPHWKMSWRTSWRLVTHRIHMNISPVSLLFTSLTYDSYHFSFLASSEFLQRSAHDPATPLSYNQASSSGGSHLYIVSCMLLMRLQ